MKNARKPNRTSDAIEILDRMVGKNERLRAGIEAQRLNIRVACMIYDARTKAGLTQAQLAEKIGTKQPVIARLEDADYEGHSLSMLQRIADALGKKISLHWANAKAVVA